MKPLNNAERKIYKAKFIGMYCISIVLILVVLFAFLQPVPVTKTIMVEKEKPAKVFIKTVYARQSNNAENNLHERDSLKAALNMNDRKMDSLNNFIRAQKSTIAELQQQSAATKQPAVNTATNKNEMEELKKQIKFYDWALRSQIAVTNTLTKENKNLKAKIDEPGNNK